MLAERLFHFRGWNGGVEPWCLLHFPDLPILQMFISLTLWGFTFYFGIGWWPGAKGSKVAA